MLPLSACSKFASSFPMAVLKIPRNQPYLVRPTFCLPSKTLNESSFAHYEIMLEHFSVEKVKCRPEAPWMNRFDGAIQFTDELHASLTDISSEDCNKMSD